MWPAANRVRSAYAASASRRAATGNRPRSSPPIDATAGSRHVLLGEAARELPDSPAETVSGARVLPGKDDLRHAIQKTESMKRILIYLLCAVIVAAAAFAYLFFRPDIATRVFFGSALPPVEINTRHVHDVPAADEKTVAIVAAANLFLDSLDDNQRQAATYRFNDNAQRSNWSNFPEHMVPRGGVKLGTLSESQRERLDRLLGELLSEYGVQNITYQLAAEDTLTSGDWFGVTKYRSDDFYAAFLGEPSTTQPWMFQFGGHHLAINATVFGPHVSFSPMLTGGQPLRFHLDGEDIFITQRETEAAQAFMDSLADDQTEQAVRSEKPIGLLLGPGKYGATVAPEGIKGSELTAMQRTLLLDVIEARLGFMNHDDYAEKMQTVVAEIEDTYFGWWGPQGVLGAAYFRVTSPSMVIEYACQDDDGGVDHAHSMYRELDNDYGSAWISAD